MQEYSGTIRGMLGHAGNTGEYRGIQENTGEYMGIQEHKREYSKLKGKMCI